MMVSLSSVFGLIFVETGDPEFHTSAPAEPGAAQAWDLAGEWGFFLGTPVAPYFFLTARHVGGAVGDVFSQGGTNYVTVAGFDDPESELRLWQVDRPFSRYAQLYRNTNEVGQALLVFGRGTQRGDPVFAATDQGVLLRGWKWGRADGRKRWGENTIDKTIARDEVTVATVSGPGPGDLLRASFDAEAGSNEVDLSVGDSGGSLFLKDGDAWKLAGINYAVDGPYRETETGLAFDAALFDTGGLFIEESGTWTAQPVLLYPQPGAFYAVRISTRGDWVDRVIAEAGSLPVVQTAFTPQGVYTDDVPGQINPLTHEVSIPLGTQTRFFRLRAPTVLRISGTTVRAGQLVLRYE